MALREGRVFEQRLQFIAEQLADALARSVMIDDAALRPLAVSAQTGLLDASRVEAVLQRRTSERHRRMLAEHGIFQAREPVSIPATDAASLPRLCLPLVHGDKQLGFLWLIDEPALTAAQIERAEAAAAQAGRLLQQRAARQTAEFDTFGTLADALLRADARERGAAARKLTDEAGLTGSPPYVVAVIRYLADAAGGRDDLPRVAGDLRRRAAPGGFVLASPGQDELVAITTREATGLLRGAVRAVAWPPLVIGTAGAGSTLAAVHARLNDARYAAEVAAHVPDFGGTADWGELGSYAVFQYLPRDKAAPERICPGITALLAERTGMYEASVRAYLDSGANAQQTAALLHIHRTTLYWRLARVADLLSVDLSSGEDRLKLHLALKLAALTPAAGT
jgi:PucR C-terminal helix-turn-helix domain